MLPTTTNLWKKKILKDPTCPRCKMKAESKTTRQMWKLTPFERGNTAIKLIYWDRWMS